MICLPALVDVQEIQLCGARQDYPDPLSQIHAVGLKGFGGKAANVLGKLATGDAPLLALLHALLQPADIAALVRTAARGAKAEDIEVGGPTQWRNERRFSIII
jgi:hypothetical protein